MQIGPTWDHERPNVRAYWTVMRQSTFAGGVWDTVKDHTPVNSGRPLLRLFSASHLTRQRIANNLFIYMSRCHTHSTWVAHLTKPVSCRWIFTGVPFFIFSLPVGWPGLTRFCNAADRACTTDKLSQYKFKFNSIQFLYETKSQNALTMCLDPEYRLFLLFSYLFTYFFSETRKYDIRFYLIMKNT